ncbi:glycosyltransferase family 25 protein [Otariodibacter oris]|uniref:Glycosyl transferase family 25 n=1 Tax=Otariodibacter oris TaxID=1032623 RepID=A0A420XI28_9PAST|nr:glycosyltransferase family 25 protein [Otariodibacter oris]QGM81063.1 Lsg locus protein 4 [Otariodibacter oris]RKR76750.1 glycosyl transferase family 25 [Otariodibacter oris]
MKKYLISLDKDTHRRELFFAQPDTRDFQVFSAFNTMNDDLDSLSKRFDCEYFLQKYARAVTKGEVGCTLSHLGVYQQIIDDESIADNDFCLICEDDALFNHDFQAQLTKLIQQGISADLVLVGQSKITDFNHLELEINYPTTYQFLQQRMDGCYFNVVYPYKNYFAGTVAYLIKKSVARKFIEEMGNKPYWLADDFILFGDKFGLDIQYVRPLMAIENPKLNSNLESIRGSVSNNLIKKLIKYPFKKLLAIKRNLKLSG